MKQFTIGLPNAHVDNNGSFKNAILNKIADTFPFFKWDMNNDKEFDLQYAGPSDRLIFDFNYEKPKFYAFNRRFWNPFNAFKTKKSVEHYNYTDLNRAMYKLHKYAEEYNDYLNDPGYDYINEYGEPVRIYKHFIQIGDTIIPFKNYGAYFLTPKKKETQKIMNTIINIVINIELKIAA